MAVADVLEVLLENWLEELDVDVVATATMLDENAVGESELWRMLGEAVDGALDIEVKIEDRLDPVVEGLVERILEVALVKKSETRLGIVELERALGRAGDILVVDGIGDKLIELVEDEEYGVEKIEDEADVELLDAISIVAGGELLAVEEKEVNTFCGVVKVVDELMD